MPETILVAATALASIGVLMGLFTGREKTKTLLRLSTAAIVLGVILFIYAISGGALYENR